MPACGIDERRRTNRRPTKARSKKQHETFDSVSARDVDADNGDDAADDGDAGDEDWRWTAAAP